MLPPLGYSICVQTLSGGGDCLVSSEIWVQPIQFGVDTGAILAIGEEQPPILIHTFLSAKITDVMDKLEAVGSVFTVASAPAAAPCTVFAPPSTPPASPCHPAPCLRPTLPLRTSPPLHPSTPPPLHPCPCTAALLHSFPIPPLHPPPLLLHCCTLHLCPLAPCSSEQLHPAPLHHCTFAPLHRCTSTGPVSWCFYCGLPLAHS